MKKIKNERTAPHRKLKIMRNIIVFILLFLSAQFAAQPGGGGGLRVLNVYDEHKQPIDVKQLKIKLLAQ